ncbi:MAG: hypothetical protein WBD40_25690 [Tepidisphaeraceae bacterium]
MAFGDPHEGLLKAIIDIFNERGPEWQQHSDSITKELKHVSIGERDHQEHQSAP